MANGVSIDQMAEEIMKGLTEYADLATEDVAFTVRWCRKASVIDSTGYRVVFGGELYDILAIDHMNYKKKSIKFKCRKARR